MTQRKRKKEKCDSVAQNHTAGTTHTYASTALRTLLCTVCPIFCREIWYFTTHERTQICRFEETISDVRLRATSFPLLPTTKPNSNNSATSTTAVSNFQPEIRRFSRSSIMIMIAEFASIPALIVVTILWQYRKWRLSPLFHIPGPRCNVSFDGRFVPLASSPQR